MSRFLWFTVYIKLCSQFIFYYVLHTNRMTSRNWYAYSPHFNRRRSTCIRQRHENTRCYATL